MLVVLDQAGVDGVGMLKCVKMWRAKIKACEED